MKTYNLNELAALLHLMPRQVQRMAERGQIPGRRNDGDWIFTHVEITHWLEDRLHNQEFLEAVASHLVCVSDLMSVESVALPLNANTARSVIEEMINTAMNTGLLWDSDAMKEAVLAREKMCSTTLGCGVALMHPRSPMVKILQEPFVVLGITTRPILTGNAGPGQGEAADIFFLICSVDDTDHLRTLARISKMIQLDGFLHDLRNAQSTEEVLDIIRSAEAKLECP